MDFGRHFARISGKDKIRNTIIKQKKWMYQDLSQKILRPNNFNGMNMFKEWKMGNY